MKKIPSVWDRLNDDIKNVLISEKDDVLVKIQSKELKETECYTSVSYGTFNNLRYLHCKKLGKDYKDVNHFLTFLKPE